MKKVQGSKSQVKKLDGRRMINQRAASKRTAAGTQPRGMDLVLHGSITSKRDPFLQQRIDMVVATAQKHDQDHSMDVVRDIHILRFSPSGLKCHKVG